MNSGFFLHYNYTDSEQFRDFYYVKLGSFWNCNYEKKSKKRGFAQGIYERLEKAENASQEEAMKRAKSLEEKFKNLPYHKQNPVTTVYKLVALLNQNSRR
ncbi:MAG: RloB family protein [Flavobacteriaceae bacterium]|nr:RloB family protein [Flavobacteriaceae bacterium]